MNSPIRIWLRWFALLLACQSPGRVVSAAEDPFSVALVNEDFVTADYAAASLDTSGDALHGGTLLRNVNYWNVPHNISIGNKLAPADKYYSDPFGVLMLTGVDHTVVSGGLGRLPVITFLPGANIGLVNLGTPPPAVLGVLP